MGEACSAYGGEGRSSHGFGGGNLKEIDYLEDPGVERILRRIFRKWDVGGGGGHGLDGASSWSSWVAMAMNSYVITLHYFKHILGSMERKSRMHLQEVTLAPCPLHIINPPQNKILNLGDVSELTVDNTALFSGMTLVQCQLWLLARTESTESNKYVSVHVLSGHTEQHRRWQLFLVLHTDCEKMLLTSATLHTNFGWRQHKMAMLRTQNTCSS
jgi:hypothetical protein